MFRSADALEIHQLRRVNFVATIHPQDVRPQHLPPRAFDPAAQRFIYSQPSTLNSQRGPAAFTLLELLIVMGIVALLMVLIAPAFTTIKGGTDVTSAAYTIKGVLDTARTYAKDEQHVHLGRVLRGRRIATISDPCAGPPVHGLCG